MSFVRRKLVNNEDGKNEILHIDSWGWVGLKGCQILFEPHKSATIIEEAISGASYW